MRPQLFVLVIGLGLILSRPADAEVVRYRYVPVDASGALAPEPTGERASWYAGPTQAVTGRPRPNYVVTLLHPYTGRNVAVPLALPEYSTPLIIHRRGDIIYNYGSHTVTVSFRPDGSVETIYNSGWLRPLRVY
jgi:hypothetical protein